MLLNPLPPSFLGPYSLSTLSLGYKVLYIAMSFLVLWSTCLTSFLVYFPNILRRGLSWCSFLLWSSWHIVWIRVVFSFPWDTLFLKFFHLFDGAHFQYSRAFVGFLFSGRSDFSWFSSSIPSVMCCFPLFIITMPHFSMPNSIPLLWLYILTTCIRVYD